MKNIDWKQILKETAIIISFTVAVGIIYNTINPYGINLLKKPQVVSDTLLENLLVDTNSANTINENSISQQSKVADTIERKIKDTLIAKNEDLSSIKSNIEQKVETHHEDIPIVSYNQLIKYLTSPNLILIDARSPEEYQKEHIGNAINIFAYEEDMNKYFQNLLKIPTDAYKVIIVYCEGGTCEASHKVAMDLIRLGHKNVFVYAGGWEEWTKFKRNKNE